MKVVLGLAFLCCFIGGIKGYTGCQCKDGIKECYCKVKTEHVIKAQVRNKVTDLGDGKLKYRIDRKATYKGKGKFKFVIVPEACKKVLKPNKRYILMGIKVDKHPKTLKTPVPHGLIVITKELTEKEKAFLKNPKC